MSQARAEPTGLEASSPQGVAVAVARVRGLSHGLSWWSQHQGMEGPGDEGQGGIGVGEGRWLGLLVSTPSSLLSAPLFLSHFPVGSHH